MRRDKDGEEVRDAVGVRRGVPVLVVIVLLLVVIAVTALATARIFAPGSDADSEESSYSSATVSEGSVESSLALAATVAWSTSADVVNGASGVVTSVDVASGGSVSAGDVLYRVDLSPVVAASGSIPMFREIGEGATGDDVRQAQQFLADTGFYGGAVDGMAGRGTASAIAAWQKALGVEVTGSIGVGDLVFIPDLPAKVVVDADALTPGVRLSGGEEILSALSSAPSFTIEATPDQASSVPSGSTAVVTSPDGDEWAGVTGAQTAGAEGDVILIALDAPDGGSICGDGCDQLDATGEANLPVDIILVPETSGLVIPVSAIVTKADGDTVVIVAGTGKEIAVDVMASAKGMAVVDGVEAGTSVRIAADGSE